MVGAHATSSGPGPEPQRLRAERDRFVAFAFCGADILIELDAAQKIVYAAGATGTLIGRSPEDFVGRSLLDIVVPDDQILLNELVRVMEGGYRLSPILVRLAGPHGPTPPLSLTGYHLPHFERHYFLALRIGPPMTAARPPQEAARDNESGLLETDAFAEVAGQHLCSTGEEAKEHRLTLLEVDNLAGIRAQLDDAARKEVFALLGGILRARSVQGETAGRFDEGRFGLIHDEAIDVDALERHIHQTTRQVPGNAAGVAVKAATVELDCAGMSETDAVKALIYTINRFSAEGANQLSIKTLSQGLRASVEHTAKEMAKFKHMVVSESFEVVYQPIVALTTGEVFYYEMLARFGDDEFERSPASLLRFAEDVGIAADFDLAMCRRAAVQLTHAARQGKPFRLAVNLSLHALRSPHFAEALQELFAKQPDVADRLFFEVEESAVLSDVHATRGNIDTLRRKGHRVCLDNFGASVSALHYLRQVSVDMVKIDSRYTRAAFGTSEGRHFFEAAAGACKELDVATIAKMVEKEFPISELTACGIDYGQGHTFGSPAASLAAFDNRR